MFSYTFYNLFANVCKKVTQNFDWDFNKSIGQLGERFHLNRIDYPNSMEHGMSIHLLRTSLIALNKSLYFLVYKSCTSFVKLTPNVFYSF